MVLLAVLATLLLLIGGLAWALARNSFERPLRVLLITPISLRGEAGLDAGQLRALGAMVQDHLEVGGGCAVTSVTELPATFLSFRQQARTLLLLLEPRRQGQDLDLSYRFTWGDQIPGSGIPSWTQRNPGFLRPEAAFQGFVKTFPAALRTKTDALTPRDPALFWEMNQASAWRLQNTRLEEATALAERATESEPSCATAWLLLGNLRYRGMLNHAHLFRQERMAADADLSRALALVPTYPRPAFLLGLIQGDSGNHREALELLFRARRQQPFNPMLLTGIAYSARGSGLLPLARKALDLRDRLTWSDLQPQAVDITFLYTGEITRFEAGLHERPGHLSSTSGVLPFYRGYLLLVKGDREGAHREFSTAAGMANGYPNIQRLSDIYRLVLEGHSTEAWVKLHEYDQERIGMWEPDGEFTLRLAEAYALMGDRASAMEMVGRSFARGFGCTAWYERSPMLESLRPLPKWQSFMQHVRERQQLMEVRFTLDLLEED